MYWYISKAKVDALKGAPQIEGVSMELGLKLPFVSGSLSGTHQPTLIGDLEKVVKKLESKGAIKSYVDLADGEAPDMIRFQGAAVRQGDEQCFWVGMESGDTALLLAGSPGYAIGAPPKDFRYAISPSADPMGAVKAAFSGIGGESSHPGMSLSNRLTYVWQTIMSDYLAPGIALPHVEGIAIFASSVPVNSAQMESINRAGMRRMVIGTPLYVRQI